MKRIKDIIISFFIYLIEYLNFLVWGIILIILSFFHTGKFFEFLLTRFCRTILFIGGVRVKIEGINNIDDKKQYILMMNHVNLFDAFVLNGSYPGKVRGIEEESHMRWPFYGWLMTRIGMIPISRKNARDALGSLKKAAEILKKQKNFSVAILPEGTRTMTGKLGNFKRGGFLLAQESGLEILPVVQVGSYEIKKKKRWIVRPGKIKLVFEKPISTTGFTKENIRDLMDDVRKVFLKYVD
ncbi:MAG: lysophospholipid acyltransferase family protein [Acidobacteriota bacterium]